MSKLINFLNDCFLSFRNLPEYWLKIICLNEYPFINKKLSFDLLHFLVSIRYLLQMSPVLSYQRLVYVCAFEEADSAENFMSTFLDSVEGNTAAFVVKINDTPEVSLLCFERFVLTRLQSLFLKLDPKVSKDKRINVKLVIFITFTPVFLFFLLHVGKLAFFLKYSSIILRVGDLGRRSYRKSSRHASFAYFPSMYKRRLCMC